MAAPVRASWGRRRTAHAGLRARASRRRRQLQARRLRCHGNRGPPVRFQAPALRPGGAGLELLGDRQRASASAARSPGFHPPPTSAWRREEVGGRLGGHVVAQGLGVPSLIRGYPARCLCEVQSPLDPRAVWPEPRETLRHCFSSLLPPLSSLDLEVP